MRTIGTWTAGAVALGAVLWTMTPTPARACGGCFAPSETVTVVTAHRMAVAISATETTLWDQIEYAGDPEDFVWVLPVQGETLVELASNAFFEALDGATAITLQANLAPLRTGCPDPCASFAGGADAGAGGAGPTSSVEVYGEAVVGPYETATIGSEDPMALIEWLQTNGYNVPDSVLPVIDHYVDLGLNFAVLRLSPNAGVSQMQPVRITTPGLMPVFPLRMVAAGVEGKVGLELYVFGEGRYEAQNFDVVHIEESDLYYDWDTGRFNYDEAFDQAIADAGGRAWVAEYAQPADRYRSFVESYVSLDPETGNRLGDAVEDWAVVTRGIEQPYLTKLRTDLAASFLDQDLILQASAEGDVDNYFWVSSERNRPSEPSCPTTTCSDPSSPMFGMAGSSVGFADGGGSRGSCSVQPGTAGSVWFFSAACAGLVLILLGRRRR